MEFQGRLWQRIRNWSLLPLSAWQKTSFVAGPKRIAVKGLRGINTRSQPEPRILLLTSGLGSGHVRAAQAIAAALAEQLPQAQVRMLDWWTLFNPGVAQAAREIYLRLVQEYPDLYERFFHLNEHTWRELLSRDDDSLPVRKLLELFSEVRADLSNVLQSEDEVYASDRRLFYLLCATGSPDLTGMIARGVRARLALLAWAWARLVRRMEYALLEFEPQLIISTQMIPAALAAQVKQNRRLNIPSIGVPTDFGVHDFWQQPGTDLYCLGHESLLDAAKLDPRRVRATGVPLMPEFRHPMSRQQARHRLGLEQQTPVVLILGGGLGLGVDAVTERLLGQQAQLQLVVVAGNNETAYERLSQLAKQHRGRMHVHRWAERIDMLICAADLVVSKPGGLTVAEVLACGRPLLATRALRGQEGFNVRFLERHQVGKLLSDEELLAEVQHLLARPDALKVLQERAWELGRRDGAAQIAELAARIVANSGQVTEKDLWEIGCGT